MTPTATTSYGALRGADVDGIAAFKGIPFARPPVGELRWRAPQKAESWSGERDATQFGPSSLQRSLPGGIGDLIGIPSERLDEDCLYLNVWTPAADAGRRPVMVWIHGGGNVVGSGSQPRIDGQHLARRGDVVVVTLNYRLGALGFLHCPEIGASGNEALLDQVAGLRWVREEIQNFGGDASNLTVFGQSAGGFDIAQLMAMPAAKGCFDKAVPMSGSLIPQVPAAEAASTAQRFAERFGGADKLRAMPAEDILDYQVELTGGSLGSPVRFGPVLDGTVITDDAAVGIGNGRNTKGMPLLIGNTRDESALFNANNEAVRALERDGLVERVAGLVGDRAEAVVAAYTDARAGRGCDCSPQAVLSAIMTDNTFRLPGIRTAELHGSHTPYVWMYLFDWESPAWEGRLGSCHSLDIPFVWGTYRAEKMADFCGSGPGVEDLSAKMMDIYLAFARTGDPSTDALPDWPRFTPERRATMHLGPDCGVENAPMEEERRALAG